MKNMFLTFSLAILIAFIAFSAVVVFSPTKSSAWGIPGFHWINIQKCPTGTYCGFCIRRAGYVASCGPGTGYTPYIHNGSYVDCYNGVGYSGYASPICGVPPKNPTPVFRLCFRGHCMW